MSDTKTKPRVLMMIDQFYPSIGGAESQALRISMKLHDKGHRVMVLTRQGKRGLTENETVDGIEINRLPILGVSGRSKIRSIIPAVRWLIKNREQYDIIHCHGVNPLEWAAYLASGVTKKPYVVKIPLSNFLNYAGAKKGFRLRSVDKGKLVRFIIRPLMLPFLKLIRKRLIRRADRVFAISPEIEDTLISSGYKNISKIPNGIDTEMFCPVSTNQKIELRKELKMPLNEIILVYTGRLSQEKNLMTLLQAWKKLLQIHGLPQTRLYFLGGGKHQSYTCEPELREYAQKNKLSSLVFQGPVSNVVNYLQACDAFVLPSLWEGMSNALLEAMACGLPAIVSDIPGNRALVEDGASGLLFETLNPDNLCDKITMVIKDSAFRISCGDRARQKALERYSLTVVTENILTEYQNILGNSRK